MTWHTVNMHFSTLPPEVMKPHYDLNKEFLEHYKRETTRLFGPVTEFTLEQHTAAVERDPGLTHLRLSAQDWDGVFSPDPNVMTLVAYRKHSSQCQEWADSDAWCLAMTQGLTHGLLALEKLKFVNHDLCIPGTLLRMSDGKEYVIGGTVGTRDIDADSIPHDGLVLECKVLL